MADVVCGNCEHWGVRSCQCRVPMCAVMDLDRWGKLTAKSDATQCWAYRGVVSVGGIELEQPDLPGFDGDVV